MSLPVPTEQTHLTHPKYRGDIDGLRAVAVLSVVAFHAFPDWVRGGFVGVDIFFVISGFLISSIILGSLEQGTFSFAEFYARRIRRIFPALILVMTSCFAFGWFALLPDEYEQLGKHIVGGAGFISNFFFWQEAGYFDNAAETKPLLHLWSLGIEEQFYIVWPLLLYMAWKRKTNLLVVSAVLVTASFSLNIRTTYSDITQAFYSPITRFWELLIGGLLAYLTLHKISLWDSTARKIAVAVGKPDALLKSGRTLLLNIQSISGLLLIGAAVFLLIHKDRSFPGWWALFPTVGAYLIISAGQHAWLNRRLLSSRFMVWTGVISYPFYLWHWPLLSFLRITESDKPSVGSRIVAIVVAMVLAWATYTIVEKPIRWSRNSRFYLAALLIVMSGLGCVGFVAYSFDGIHNRAQLGNIDPKLKDILWDRSQFDEIKCPNDMQSPPRLSFCSLSGNAEPKIALFGDSHADHIFPGIVDLDRKNTWLFVGNHSCPPVSGISVANPLVSNCQQLTEKALNEILRIPSIKTVVLSFYGNYMLSTPFAKDHKLANRGPQDIKITSRKFRSKDKRELFYLGLDNTVRVLENHGISVIIIIDVPELPFLPRDCIRPSIFGNTAACTLPTETALGRQRQLREVVGMLERAHPQLRVYDPITLLCDTDQCKYQTDEFLIYRDSHHLSHRGGRFLVNDFLTWMELN